MKSAVDTSGSAERSASERLTALRSHRFDPPFTVEPGREQWPLADPIPVFGVEQGPRFRTPPVPVPRGPSASSANPRGQPPGGAATRRIPDPRPRPDPVRSPVESTSPLPVVAGGSGRLGRLLERWVPPTWRGSRLDPGRPAAAALVLVAALAAVLAAVAVWRDRPVAQVPPSLAVVGESGRTAPVVPASVVPAAALPGDAPAVVSVVGKVRKPGLVRLPAGARVADAIGRAGGTLPKTDLTTVNLARRVADGEQIVVGLPRPAEAELTTGPAPAAAAGPAPAGKVDLNRATLEQFDVLPGVGPVTAQRIIDWRTKHGRFTTVEQLREIDGIGERRFGQLKDQVTI